MEALRASKAKARGRQCFLSVIKANLIKYA